MMRRNSILLIAAMLITLSSCAPKSQERTVIEKDDKIITVIEGEEAAGSEELLIEKIEEFKNIRGLDWQDEEKLLISKENKNVDKIQSEGEAFYPNNLYIFDTKTKEAKILKEDRSNQAFAKFSPDKKHIFYKKNSEETARGYIMDSDGNNEVLITGDNAIHVMAGNWIDNERVFYPDFSGTVYEADISGKNFKLVQLKAKSINKAYKIGDQIYFISLEGELIKYDTVTDSQSVVEKDVFDVIPSQNPNRIAYIKMNQDEKDALIVCDNDFSNKKILVESENISGTSWSPDNTRIVYSISSDDKGNSGTYVSDLKTGKSTRIALSKDVLNLSWSPSGKKLAICQVHTDEDVNPDSRYAFSTTVITLSK